MMWKRSCGNCIYIYRYNHDSVRININWMKLIIGFEFYIKSFSTIFQLYHIGQINWWRKPEITKDLHNTLKKYSKVVMGYILQLRTQNLLLISFNLYLFFDMCRQAYWYIYLKPLNNLTSKPVAEEELRLILNTYSIGA
jgi:hypothetical protein